MGYELGHHGPSDSAVSHVEVSSKARDHSQQIVYTPIAMYM